MPSPIELAQAVDAAKLRALMPYLEAELAPLMAQVEMKAADLYQKGELVGERAVQLWAEYLAYRRILRRADQTVRFGTSVGASIGPEMDLPTP